VLAEVQQMEKEKASQGVLQAAYENQKNIQYQ
jgi:hypothetical protein